MTCERLLTSFAACVLRYAQLQRRYATPRAFHMWYPSLYLLQTSPAECVPTVWESNRAKAAPCAWAPVLYPSCSPPLSPAALSPPSHALPPGSTSASLGVHRSCTRRHLPTGKDALCCRVWAKRKKKNHLSKTSCSAAQQFTFQGLYRLPHCPMRETAPFLKSHPLTCLPQTPHSHRKWDIVSIMNTFHMCLRVPAKEKYQKPAATWQLSWV